MDVSVPQTPYERIELARDLYRQFHARCFWQSPRGLEINEHHIPFVIKGLRMHGGRIGFMLAGYLRPTSA